MKIHLLPLILIFSFRYGIQAQIVFERSWPDSQSQSSNYLVQLSDSGFAFTGSNFSTPNGLSDISLIRTDKYGDTLWMKTYGGSDTDFSYSVEKTSDGGFVIAGMTKSFGIGTPAAYNWYLIRTNSFGDTLWTKWYGTAGDDGLHHAFETSDGGLLLSGGRSGGNPTGYLAKMDSAGNEIWHAWHPGGFNSNFWMAYENTANEYITTGKVSSPGWDISLIKYSSTGSMLISKVYNSGGTNTDTGGAIAPASDGGTIIAATSNVSGNQLAWVLKTNGNLDTTWTRMYNGMFNNLSASTVRSYSIQPCTGGYVLCASNFSHLCIAKLDTTGNNLWSRYYGISPDAGGYMAIQTSDGGFAACGFNYPGNADHYLVKTDSLGCIGVPNTPSIVNAPAQICQGVPTTIRVQSNPIASSYQWTLPPGWLGSSTTDTISVIANSNSGQISVTVTSICGVSTPLTLPLSIIQIPAMPSAITGPITICFGSGAHVFSVTNDISASGYTWTLPANWVGSSTTNSISASAWQNGGNVSVVANNVCGSSLPRTLHVNAGSTPIVTFTVFPPQVCNTAQPFQLTGGLPTGGTYSGPGVTANIFYPAIAGVGNHSLQYSYTDTINCSAYDNDWITVNLCSSVDENMNETKIIVSPNPSNGLVSIQTDTDLLLDARIELFDIYGKQIQPIHILPSISQITLDLTDLESGIYFLNLVSCNKSRAVKFAIVRD